MLNNSTLVRCFKISPTAIGLTSGEEPGFNLFNAVSELENRNFSSCQKVTTFLSQEQMEIGSGMTSNHCVVSGDIVL